ncbi:MAG TPA: metal ABC transporter permease [Methylomirabilota bacterium]|nr:metal ABC transporter permease [Methylomirabilota bacterium]
MELLQEIFHPTLRNSVYVSLLIGLVCPLVGTYLVLRRLIFMGVALPQISSCGIAFAFALHAWHIVPHLDDSSENALAFGGSTLFTLATLFVLTFLQRRYGRLADARIGAAYVLAGAFSILLLVKNPYGEHGLLDRLRGEIIAVSDSDLLMTAVAFGIVAIALIIFRKEFLLVSFDPEMATTLRKNVLTWDGLLFLLIGITISMSVLSVGPLVTFGFLLLPPLIARTVSRNMAQLAFIGCLVGALSAFVGFCLAYRWDVPVGPTDVALLGVIYLLVSIVKACWRRSRRWLRPTI